MNKDDRRQPVLTEKQRIQLAEVEAAKQSSGDTTTTADAGGSDANSGPAKAAAPVSAGTPAGNADTTPGTATTTSTAGGTSTARR